MEWIDGGVTSPEGFRASAVRAGLKKEGPDIAVLECPGGASAAALFTRNKVKAAPVVLSLENLRRSGGRVRAVVINSGNANACTGNEGLEAARKTSLFCADLLGCAEEEILVASTGVIGRPFPLDKILSGLRSAVGRLSGGREASKRASAAIMTTDTVPKEAAIRIRWGEGLATIAGMAKGSGMIHPNLATMLAFVTTDAELEPDFIREALLHAADQSFNMITVDRDTSTNDTLLLMSSGLAGQPETGREESLSEFRDGLTQVCISLAKQMVADAEGATKSFEVRVKGAASLSDARICARSIAGSNLVKTAIFGTDPNWGRIVAAAGYSGAALEPERVSLWLEADDQLLEWVSGGRQISEKTNDRAREILGKRSFRIILDLGLGDWEATAWGCDLTYDYVKINSEYTT